MNKKTVGKILKRKHLDFLKSIKDDKVRELIQANSMITGGAIASGLLNEPINDYDYYFTDFETCKAIADYYVKQFLELNPKSNVKPVVKVIEPTILDPLPRVTVRIPSVGSIEAKHGIPPQQFESEPKDEEADLMLRPGTSFTAVGLIEETDDISAEILEGKDGSKPKYRPIFMTSNAITLSNKVQLILRFYGEPDKIHENYDFVHCTNYWLSRDYSLHLNQAALESLLSKTLYYVGSKYPLSSVIRTRKFIKRGWHINAGQYVKMCFQISRQDLSDISTLEDQLTGVDQAYFHQIIGFFKEKVEKDETYKIEMEPLVSIIDKIF